MFIWHPLSNLLCHLRMIEHLGHSTSLLFRHLQLKLVPNQRTILRLSKLQQHLNSPFFLATPLRNNHHPIRHSNGLVHHPPGDDLTPASHVALSRFSTAPPFESFADSLTANGKHDPETRYISSTTKLTKMGFSARDSLHPTVPNPVSPRSHEQKPRFRLKSFFQGKS